MQGLLHFQATFVINSASLQAYSKMNQRMIFNNTVEK